MNLLTVQRHGIAVPDAELLPGERTGCGKHLLRWGWRRHREHNFMDQLGFPGVSTLVTWTAILPSGQLEMPGRQKHPLRIGAGNPLTLVERSHGI